MLKEQIVDKQANVQATPNLTPAQEALQAVWEEHIGHEFGTHSTEDALASMVEDAYVNHIPVMTGGVGKPALREFYSKYFIPQMPPDIDLAPVSRTIGTNQLVDEMLVKFTHTIQMDWMLPGIAPTGKRIEVAVVAIVQFRDGKLAHEHLYWDQASVLVQLGILDPVKLPVVGVDSARKIFDPSLPSNALIDREAIATKG
ncbi:ester cyclase [Nodosilinea sp. FACHB-131]|uniref:ester cyclase n=1 Tax=Cyanophyceae TaxID=3028117 RepID=UPI00168561EB|nr:ester cyclase [Nodosilinea sp. FACHB-131]MBD1874477.1 ester cyclase [Nodosilinea sp. FACHB-131]